MWGGLVRLPYALPIRAVVPVSPLLLFPNSDIGLDSSRAQSVIGHRVSIRVRREGPEPAVVRPRPEGEQMQAHGTMLPRRVSF